MPIEAVSVPLARSSTRTPEALRQSLHPFEHATAALTAAQRTRSGAGRHFADIAAVRLAVLAAACVVINFGAPRDAPLSP